MDRRPTLADVARTAGVSRAAASRAMNGAYGVSVTVRRRLGGVGPATEQ
ncbi:LacI family DNA-binding transcriptional regulator, partial [Actinoplanes philippinensis]